MAFLIRETVQVRQWDDSTNTTKVHVLEPIAQPSAYAMARLFLLTNFVFAIEKALSARR